MQKLNSSEIKQILLGVLLSDGYVDRSGRFQISQVKQEYATYVRDVMLQITGVTVWEQYKDGALLVHSRTHPYFKSLKNLCYHDRKYLCHSTVKKITLLSLANMWMCDGYLEHPKNRVANKVQNIGWFCLESFPKEELTILIDHIHRRYGCLFRLAKKPWGFGYRLKISGLHLQRFISLIYQHILPCFEYKTWLYYKSAQYVDMTLPSAEQYSSQYSNVEEIVQKRNNDFPPMEPVS